MLSRFIAGPWIYVAIALACAGVGGWIVGAVKDNEYTRLELAFEQYKNEQSNEYLMRLEAFEMKRQAAADKTAAELVRLREERATRAANLTQAIEQESAQDETLKACLATRLPDSVLLNLP